ncbi:serine/threonine-protein kinase [Sciscionella sediminilitoris]|uniref:serine/threonine-protein kinase n=1 Tax=Sciscionella sediminilitoris TaxID=1445613 RepID=UPI0004DED6AA|nr:serine/threonine-protein kinase [Sciscionella sp. SE31]
MLLADRYELEELPIGKGGMGAVHRGYDTHLARRVAVKFLEVPGNSDPEVEGRFIREARILAKLELTGAPTLYDLGTVESRLFQVMQFVDGVTLADVLAEHGPLPVPWAAAIAAQSCAVLAEAHALSICHRDLKPNNLMLRPDGGVTVLDFGLAVLREADLARFTRAGQLLGTPAYMAPEQIQNGSAGPASDLYALGCVLHEMLTGAPLFTGPTAYAVFEQHVNARPPEIPGIPARLDEVLARMLEKEPGDRPADALDCYAALEPLARELPPLPGFLAVNGDPVPARMYARIVGRIPDRFSSAR